MRYDIGDKVLIKSIDWYDVNKDHLGEIWFHNGIFLENMAKYCGKICTIEQVTKYGYKLKGIPYDWNDKMIEGLVEKKGEHISDNDKIIQLWLDYLHPRWNIIKAELKKKRKKENNYLDKEKRVLFEEVNSWPACKIPQEKVERKENKPKDMGEVSDGYHIFNELYEYRLLYNASMFNELAKQGLYDVHKSKRHSDGEVPFGDSNWFIVMAELPTGQISNHYEMKDWNLFQIPEKEKANKYDGHTPKDVAERIRKFLTPKPKYPTTYEECYKIIVEHTGADCNPKGVMGYKYKELQALQKLLICRDAYWKIAGEEMGLGKSWEPDWRNSEQNKYAISNDYGKEINSHSIKCSHITRILAFPT